MAILEHYHQTEQSGDAAWDVHVGYMCGAPYATGKQLRCFRHTRACLRRGQPFIRLVLQQLGTEYVCHGCKRAWTVPEPYFGDKRDNPHPLSLPPDWWGWKLAAGYAPTQMQQGQVWVQECGRGLAHLQRSYGIICGRTNMGYPFAAADSSRRCKRCVAWEHQSHQPGPGNKVVELAA